MIAGSTKSRAKRSRASTTWHSSAPEPPRLVLDHLVVLAGLAEVDRQADDLGLVGVLDPLQHHARVEPARVEQQDALDLGGVGLVARGRLVVEAGSGELSLPNGRGLRRFDAAAAAFFFGRGSAWSSSFRSGRRLGRRRSVVVSVVVGSVGRLRWSSARSSRSSSRVVGSEEIDELESLPLSLPAITTTAITRPTITAIRPATSSRMFPWGCRGPGPPAGPSSGSGPRASPYSSGPSIASRISLGVLDLEAVSQPHLDLLPAAAGDRHLGGQQAGRGRARRRVAARRSRRRPPLRGLGRLGARPARSARAPRGSAGARGWLSSRSAASRRRSATIRSALRLGLLEVAAGPPSRRRRSRSSAARSAASTIAARRSAALLERRRARRQFLAAHLAA